MIKKSYARYRRGGVGEFKQGLNREYFSLIQEKVDHETICRKWIKKNEKDILKTEPLAYNPLISIITPTHNTEKKYLVKMIESVLAQTYANWELCIADDVSIDPQTIQTLQAYEKNYTNIKVTYRKNNGHISQASNSALELACGEYVAFLDHDDMLAPNALYEMVKKLNENKNLKLIYSDEDKIDSKGNRFEPHFKSGWNPDMFYAQNYLSHLVLLRKDIVDKLDGFRPGYEGSQDYDLLLRSLEYIDSHEIDRIEKILYHWRATSGSTALNHSEKSYTTQAGIRALQDHFSRQNRNVHVQEGLLPNTYKVSYSLPTEPPLVSLLIPTRDGYDILSKCIESILEKTTYPNYEIIILDNQTTDTQTLNYFNHLQKSQNIAIIRYNYPFNYSSINNFGIQYAKGAVVGLINNDVEVIGEGWLTEMVSHALREEIGVVGSKLYYDDLTIQHAGVILGIKGMAEHSQKYFPRDSNGYFSRLKIIQNYSAVTGACLVLRKSIFEEVGGLDEKYLSVTLNDIDLCLKVSSRGYRNLWTPYAELYHHESKTRSKENTHKRLKRSKKEINYMQVKYKDMLEQGDPYYNKNLTLDYPNFNLK